MLRNPPGTSATTTAERSWLTPRNLIVAGAAVNAVAVVLAVTLSKDALIPLRVVLILTGLALALAAVNRRLGTFAENIDERSTTAAYLAAGSFVVLLAYAATDAEWDSFRLILGVFVGVGLAGGVLVLLPMVVRRVIIMILVLFHFGGILTAVFSVPPPSGQACWMTSALWTYIYRPYLQVMYLNNAYHFYSPEPGAATQLWFLVSYEDKKVPPHWVQYPRREDFHTRLLYQRSLAMNESTTQQRVGFPPDYLGPRGRAYRRFEERSRIPYHPDLQADKSYAALPDASQYREPNDLSAKKYIASYARHVARDPKYSDPDGRGLKVKSVRVYRVLHSILTPTEFNAGYSPDEPAKMLPVYMGEFDPDGELLDPGDPLLYWVVPIYREPRPNGESVIKNYVTVHAGSNPPWLQDK
jgi:hypothetical protein